VGDESISRPWSKYSEGSSAFDRKAQKNQPEKVAPEKIQVTKKKAIVSEEQALLEKIKTDPGMRAFVDAMKPRSKSKVWANEGDGLDSAVTVKQEAVKSKKAGGDDVLLTRTHMKFDSDTSSDEEYDDAPAMPNKVHSTFVCVSVSRSSKMHISLCTW
jgi:multiple RNA-binding domain-containing protein 1